MSPLLTVSFLIDQCIYFSRNGLCTENRLRSQRAPTPYKIKINIRKCLNFVIRIALTRAILMSRFSNFLRNSIIHFRMFLNFETCFLGVTVSLLSRLQAVSKIHVQIYPYLISDGKRNFSRPCGRHVNETVTGRKHVTKIKNMRKWMVEFVRKFENRGIKIVPYNSILITKSINLQLFSLIWDGVGGTL